MSFTFAFIILLNLFCLQQEVCLVNFRNFGSNFYMKDSSAFWKSILLMKWNIFPHGESRHSSITSPFFFRRGKVKSSQPEVFLGKGVLKIYSKFAGGHPCRNHTSTWVFSCKFAAYFQNTFLWEHLWRANSEKFSQ